MGLIAREIERRGVATLCMTSALSITRAVNPPRAAFVDFPLGRTAGKPHRPELQRALVADALRAFETLDAPGGVVSLPYRWDDDERWKQASSVLGSQGRDGAGDERRERSAEPRYQCEEDRRRAESALAAGGCPGCVWLDPAS